MTDALAPALVAIVALLAVEAGALFALHRFRGIGIAPSLIFANAVAGVCLLMAVRSALIDAPAGMTALWVAGAGIGHVTDVWFRWQQGRTAGGANRPRVDA